MPKLSILIPVYNEGEYISTAIKSILSQTFQDFEIIISDNDSNDCTASKVKEYLTDSRVKYIKQPKNIGVQSNYKACLEKATGQYALTIGGDDFLLPGCLSILMDELIRNKSLDIAYGNVFYVNENDKVIGVFDHVSLLGYKKDAFLDNFCEILAHGLYIKMQSTIVKISLLRSFFLENNNICDAGDADFFLYCSSINSTYKFVNKVVSVHRRHLQQYSNPSFYHKGKHLLDNLFLWEKYIVKSNVKRLKGYEDKIISYINQNIVLYEKNCIEKDCQVTEQHLNRVYEIVRMLQLFKKQNYATDLSFNPVVSIVLPTKNRPELLQYAVKSVLDQNYENWELLIINDGGCDVESLIMYITGEDSRVHYININCSIGHAAARNIGVSKASGQIVTYLDDDDIYYENHLSIIVERMISGCSVVYTGCRWTLEDVQEGERVDIEKYCKFIDVPYSRERLQVENFIPMISLAHRRDCLSEYIAFDENLTELVDWDFILSLSERYEITKCPEITVNARQRKFFTDNVSRENRINFIRTFKYIYNKHPSLNSKITKKRIKRINSLLEEVEDNSSALNVFEKNNEEYLLNNLFYTLSQNTDVVVWGYNEYGRYIVDYAEHNGFVGKITAIIDRKFVGIDWLYKGIAVVDIDRGYFSENSLIIVASLSSKESILNDIILNNIKYKEIISWSELSKEN